MFEGLSSYRWDCSLSLSNWYSAFMLLTPVSTQHEMPVLLHMWIRSARMIHKSYVAVTITLRTANCILFHRMLEQNAWNFVSKAADTTRRLMGTQANRCGQRDLHKMHVKGRRSTRSRSMSWPWSLASIMGKTLTSLTLCRSRTHGRSLGEMFVSRAYNWLGD